MIFRLLDLFCNEPALAVLASLWPWLSEPKREQVERVLSELEGRYEKTA